MKYTLPLLKITSGRNFGMPLYLIFFVTNRCNAHCRHCFYHVRLNSNNDAELNLDEIEKISLQMGRLFTINFTGGEPFLKSDLDKIAYLFYKNTHVNTIGIPTNGLLTDNIVETVKAILKNCSNILLNVNVSLDAIGQAHDAIRGVAGIFDASYRTIVRLKSLHSRRLQVGICMTLSKNNQGSIMETYTYIKNNLKPDFISFLLLRGNVVEQELKNVDPVIYKELCHKIEYDIKKSFSGPALLRLVAARDILARRVISDFMKMNAHRNIACYAGNLTGVINEEGDVFACELLNLKFGNLREYDYNFRKIWNSAQAQRVRGQIKQARCFCTHECFLNNNILFNKNYWFSLCRQVFNLMC